MTTFAWSFAAVAFAIELALVVCVAVVGWRHAGWAGAVAAVALVGCFWALVMSPNAGHRLPHVPRLAVAGVLLAGAGHAAEGGQRARRRGRRVGALHRRRPRPARASPRHVTADMPRVHLIGEG